MTFTGFTAGTLPFLADLAEHNDRTWFAENRARYELELLNPERAFIDAIGERFEGVDPRVQCVPAVNGSIFRINRDTRFTPDKSPYKTYADLFFWIGRTRKSDPGYFLRMTPGELWVGCGAHSLTPEQLAKLRHAIDAAESGTALEMLLADLKRDGFEIGDQTLARVPAGFSADGPRADLLRYTRLHAILRTPPPAEFESEAFVDWCMERFLRTKGLVDWLVDALD